jgi:hypothetical protein
MSEYNYLNDRLAQAQIAERVEAKQRSRIPGQRRRTARQAVRRGLHHLTNRLDN